MKLDYFEIRACIDFGDHTESYLGFPERDQYGNMVTTPASALEEARSVCKLTKTPEDQIFWTLYMETTDDGAVAVGDFKTFEAAYAVQCAILAPMREAADKASSWGDDDPDALTEAASLLEDICNQSSTEERL